MSIGERIKSARIGAGLTQRGLGERMGLSAMAISKYEQGKIIPGSRVLILLAQVLDVKIEYFFRSASVTLSHPHYRCREALSKQEEDRIHAKVLEWLERYIEIEQIMGEEKPLMLPSKAACRVASLDEIEDVAQHIRNEWELGLDPIENVMDVLEQHGIKVGVIETVDKFDALTFYSDGKTPVIAVNNDMPGDRQRFSLAHELGHLLLRVEGGINEEKMANRFAGAFLVPEEMAYRELGEKRRTIAPREFYMLKHKYGMSMSAWLHRAAELGIISRAATDRLRALFNNQEWWQKEPGNQVAPEQPTHMELLVLRAVSEERISQSRAQELYGGEQFTETVC